MLPFFFRHYDPFVERYVIYDNHSTDASVEILRRHPRVTLKNYSVESDSFVDTARQLYDDIWKASRGQADWVIVCNIDEHFHHPHLPGYLQRCREAGVTVIPAVGYEMISDTFPSENQTLSEAIPMGAPFHMLDKTEVFDPAAIEEINFTPGRHQCSPSGRVVYPETTELKLLHFKYLGFDYVKTRFAELKTGLRSFDIEKRMGTKYLWDEEQIKQRFNALKQNAVRVLENGSAVK